MEEQHHISPYHITTKRNSTNKGVANALTVFVILRYILGCVVLYNKITKSVTL